MQDSNQRSSSHFWSRRRFLQAVSAAGVTSVVFSRALLALAEPSSKVTPAMIQQAEWVAGLELDAEKRELLLKAMNELCEEFRSIREVPLDNSHFPALFFDPAPDQVEPVSAARSSFEWIENAPPPKPASPDSLAFLTISELSRLIRKRQLSSVELTRHYLQRMDRHDPTLHTVITRTDDLALRQAELADREIGAGNYRGPLHGIPWGAKDLLALPGYRTTWGAMPYKEQTRPETATVVSRLEDAGAVLLAKLSVGALAWGDVWFDATTRNPWNPEQGSSGSSAGPAAATAAGLVGFSIGTETWGSIVSPSDRCGVTGLRPTFGRVSRHGCMALSWSMDKIGPIARSVQDCAAVFHAIHGPDGLDPTVREYPFSWPSERDFKTLRIGYPAQLFEEDRTAGVEDDKDKQGLLESQQLDRQTLQTLRDLGFELTPIELPNSHPIPPLGLILTAEASAAFDDLTRSGRDGLLMQQEEEAWPNYFRLGQFIPAVEYLRANRIRSLLMADMEALFSTIDVYVSPSFGGDNLLLTNLTGNPAVVLPNGFRTDNTPGSITFTGRLYGEAELLTVAQVYQQATGFHLRYPPLSA
jgi:Asp-tRNA(Asn)/Glu-tRNA(Gln) amidotransferase A subunit family amidase